MKFLFFLFISLGLLLGAEVSLAESDFFERTINFLIFFSILWYLGADKIKQIFVDRRLKIAKEFDSIQEREQESKQEIQRQEKLLIDAQTKAKEIVANAKREAFIIAQQFDARLDQDIKNISSSFEEVLKQEERKMLQQEISNIMDSSLKKTKISQEACMQILAKGLKNG